jgi:hypothetical protein
MSPISVTKTAASVAAPTPGMVCIRELSAPRHSRLLMEPLMDRSGHRSDLGIDDVNQPQTGIHAFPHSIQ